MATEDALLAAIPTIAITGISLSLIERSLDLSLGKSKSKKRRRLF